jgi:serine/threonine protein kinase
MQQPTRIDRYELGPILGHGSTGTVYLARDTKLDREVALKLINPELAQSSTARTLFHREAKAIAKLTHPNIIALHDYSGPESATVFLVVERLRGHNLLEWVKKRGAPLSPSTAAAAGYELSLALQHAHEHDIVHRDLKPENVFLEAEGRLVLCDFGIARDFRTAEKNVLASRRTTVAGSPRYMSPEQIASPQAVGPASDLFSLGSILYYLITAEHAFSGNTIHKVMTEITNGNARPLIETHPRVPRAYSDIVQKLLQRDPERRFGSARDVGAALLGFLHDNASMEGKSRDINARDPRRLLASLSFELPARVLEKTSMIPIDAVRAGSPPPQDTVITLLQPKHGAQKSAESAALPVPPSASSSHTLEPRFDEPEPKEGLGVLFWSVIAATMILLCGIAVAELEAFEGLRAQLRHGVSK